MNNVYLSACKTGDYVQSFLFGEVVGVKMISSNEVPNRFHPMGWRVEKLSAKKFRLSAQFRCGYAVRTGAVVEYTTR